MPNPKFRATRHGRTILDISPDVAYPCTAVCASHTDGSLYIRNSNIFVLDFHGTVGGTFNML